MFPGLLLTVRQSGQCGLKVGRGTHGRDIDISTVRLHGNLLIFFFIFKENNLI